jgi:hypothetical protein
MVDTCGNPAAACGPCREDFRGLLAAVTEDR